MLIQVGNDHRIAQNDLTVDVQHNQDRGYRRLKWTGGRYQTCHHNQRIEEESEDRRSNDDPGNARLLVP